MLYDLMSRLFETTFEILTLEALAFAIVTAFIAGLIKGIVGFAMPMILMTGLSMVLPPELALAAIIFPTLATNLQQVLRFSLADLKQTAREFRLFLIAGMLMMMFSAQLVTLLSDQLLFLLIGIPITFFTALQILGVTLSLKHPNPKWDIGVGGTAGFIGGLSGIWGPPTVMYLNFLNVPKTAHIRTQGIIYGLGTVSLLASHLHSGVVRLQTVPLSALLVIPAVTGMIIGTKMQDRLDQKKFKVIILYVLGISGLNLIRRGLF